MIRVTPDIEIAEAALEESFIQASGPGGQNVNKVATAVQLRFDPRKCAALDDALLGRLRRLAGRRMTGEGVLVIEARRYRSQARNREDARERLAALLRKAAEQAPPRRKTRPTAASKRRRLEGKQHRAETKRHRRPVPRSDE